MFIKKKFFQEYNKADTRDKVDIPVSTENNIREDKNTLNNILNKDILHHVLDPFILRIHLQDPKETIEIIPKVFIL